MSNSPKKTGTVLKNSSAKTVSILVEKTKEHPLYHKKYKSSKKFLAHTDEKLEPGDTVIIEETRPISKNKHWKVIGVIKK